MGGAQVASGAGIAVGFALSPLAVARLSGSDTIAGLAGTATTLGAAAMALPTALASGRGGRRAGLSLAYSAAVTGCVIAVLAIQLKSWPVLLAGLVLFGGGSAGNLAARYSAIDLAPPDRTARHLSWIVWAATAGTVAGPNIAEPAERAAKAVGLTPAAGPFALAAIAFLIALTVINAGLRPDPLLVARAELHPAEPGPTGGWSRVRAGWAAIREAPEARLALVVIAVSHTAMVSIMSMTPVHLDHGGSSISVIGFVISLHVAGMYLFSPVVGWLADRIGRRPVMYIGAVTLLAAAGLAGTAGHGVPQITVALFLLGVGWSCGLVAGSATLTASVPAERRPAVQGLSDLLMNVCGATGTLAAGAVVGTFGYGVLGTAVAIMVAVTGFWVLSRPAKLALT
ncbi:MFS transporter [Streptosporangiaceae bacterium NEAU-GS5]|nr:MFS transporter [Streptosporangiaceae bacterium NEAU-GS5]